MTHDTSISINTSLVTERKEIAYIQSSFKEQIDMVYNWVVNHRELYPHYFEGVDNEYTNWHQIYRRK